MKFEKRSGDEAEKHPSSCSGGNALHRQKARCHLYHDPVHRGLSADGAVLSNAPAEQLRGAWRSCRTPSLPCRRYRPRRTPCWTCKTSCDEAQTTIDALESSAEETDAALAEAQRENQALLALYTIQQQYSAGTSGGLSSQHRRLRGDLNTGTHCPETAEEGVTPPSAAVCAAKGSSRSPLSSQRLAIVSRETCNII